MKVIREFILKEMPFDKFCQNSVTGQQGFVHATGRMVMTEDGQWFTEYEDDEYEDSEDIITEYEDDDDEDWTPIKSLFKNNNMGAINCLSGY